MKEMFTRTQFAVDQGGYFPEIKVCIVIGYQAVDQGRYFPEIKA